ncbi:MAG: hypothetical protein VXY34_06455, partial [Bdellovibrionota bacterium]|nr:hypothetical protein [Bdellovibrionota bacterium]
CSRKNIVNLNSNTFLTKGIEDIFSLTVSRKASKKVIIKGIIRKSGSFIILDFISRNEENKKAEK